MVQSEKRILVVEDDVDIREALTELLQSEGFEVDSVANGHEGIKFLGEKTAETYPALILLDLMMPIKDGWEFRAEQRADPRFSHIPVIVLSADGGLKQKAEAIEADGYLKKPIEVDALLDIVQKYCS